MARGIPYKDVLDADELYAEYLRHSNTQQAIINRAARGPISEADRLTYDESVARQGDIAAAAQRNTTRYNALAGLSAQNIQKQEQIIQGVQNGQGAGIISAVAVMAAKAMMVPVIANHNRNFPENPIKSYSNHRVRGEIMKAERRNIQLKLTK